MRRTYTISVDSEDTLDSLMSLANRVMPYKSRSNCIEIDDLSELCDARTGNPVPFRYNFITGYMEDIQQN